VSKFFVLSPLMMFWPLITFSYDLIMESARKNGY